MSDSDDDDEKIDLCYHKKKITLISPENYKELYDTFLKIFSLNKNTKYELYYYNNENKKIIIKDDDEAVKTNFIDYRTIFIKELIINNQNIIEAQENMKNLINKRNVLKEELNKKKQDIINNDYELEKSQIIIKTGLEADYDKFKKNFEKEKDNDLSKLRKEKDKEIKELRKKLNDKKNELNDIKSKSNQQEDAYKTQASKI